MDQGSNKSLFTLIAVVIFGIFLSLSYWMFQEELKGVLGSVIDKTSDSISEKVPNTYLTKLNEVTITDYALSFFCDEGSEVTLLDVGSNHVTYSTLGKYYSGDGFYVQAKNLEIAKNYVLTYDITKWSGDLPKLGGRLTLSDNIQVYMDGVLIGGVSEYNNGFAYPNDNLTHHLEISLIQTN
jgi:hypothetical protein